MERVGRKPRCLEHVDKLDGSSQAKERLKYLLATLSGELTIPEACAALEICESRFHQIRNEWLQAAVSSLEPATPGRPLQVSPESERIAELEQELARSARQLELAQLKAELARTLPMAGRRLASPKTAEKQKTPRGKKSRMLRPSSPNRPKPSGHPR
jgi:hypothetical protein